MADKKKMSVEDILAACRKADAPGGGSSPPAPAKGPKAEAAGATDESNAAPAKSAVPKPASGGAPKSPAGMSVADILAAARAEKSAAAAKPAPAQPAAPAAKPAAGKPAAGKPAAGKPAAVKASAAAGEAPAAALDTSSILAAARKANKPGPVSKAEAPVRGAGPGKPVAVVPPFPEKPTYAKAVAASSGGSAKSTRRGFLSTFLGSGLAAGFTALTITSLLDALGLARFMFPNIRTEPPSQFKVGFPANFAPGSVSTQYTSQFGVWIVNADYDGQPVIVALRTVCTHLGCTPSWLEGEQKFKCPCHGSGFYKDGINFEGPAPRPLERYAIRVADDGQLEVDKSRMFQQEMGQWKDPASFVPA